MAVKECVSSKHSVSLPSERRNNSERIPLSAFEVAGRDLNQEDICIGLSSEWLLLGLQGNASSRLERLDYHSDLYQRAGQLQSDYDSNLQEHYRQHTDFPLLEAEKDLLRSAGMHVKREPETIIYSGNREEASGQVANKIAKNGKNHLLSLRFSTLDGHAIAASTQNGRFHLFDPNLGEFESSLHNAEDLVEGIVGHYDAHGRDVAAINLYRV